MEKIVFLAYFVLIALDMIIISDARRLLLDFLVGARNRKNAAKIHAEQSLRNRISMGYILPMLKKNERQFGKYHALYLAVLYSLIPQYTAVVVFHVFWKSVIWYVFGGCLTLRFVLAVFYRLELGPNRISVYAQKN
ncbi:MAG: hypothetical protein IJX69_00615 [Oscillospiraceae bacterium]|nr:hypothetical protein [Oscillospiraceae bacterium]